MKPIRLVDGHFDSMTAAGSLQPRQQLHKRLPHGDWVNSASGLPMTHDVYQLSANSDQRPVYSCLEQAIEKSTWLKLQKLRGAP